MVEGVRGNDYTGDIAIDDLSYQTTPCGCKFIKNYHFNMAQII